MPSSPRVRCDSCAFAWYGASAAHGLQVLAACPRCGGHLEFLDEPEAATVPGASDGLRELAPAAVLGTPTSWAR